MAAGAPRAVVAALTTHTGSSDVCFHASWALSNLAWSDSAHRTAIVAAGAVAPLAAALARHPGETREKVHSTLELLGYTNPGKAREKVHSTLEQLGKTNAGAAK